MEVAGVEPALRKAIIYRKYLTCNLLCEALRSAQSAATRILKPSSNYLATPIPRYGHFIYLAENEVRQLAASKGDEEEGAGRIVFLEQLPAQQPTQRQVPEHEEGRGKMGHLVGERDSGFC